MIENSPRKSIILDTCQGHDTKPFSLYGACQSDNLYLRDEPSVLAIKALRVTLAGTRHAGSSVRGVDSFMEEKRDFVGRLEDHKSDNLRVLFFPVLTLIYDPENGEVMLSDQTSIITHDERAKLRQLIDNFYIHNDAADVLRLQSDWNERDKQRAASRKANPKPPKSKLAGTIYLLKAEDGRFKIGRTKSLNSRLRSISTASPQNIQLAHSLAVSDMLKAESYLHKKFKDKRGRGEWFNLEPEDVAWIRSLKDGSLDKELGE